MDDKTFKLLEQEVHPDSVMTLMRKCESLVKKSRHVMVQKYDVWDAANETYLGKIAQDSEDKKASEKGEPQKMIVPLTFAQTQSFASFVFLLLLQNDKFYELQGTGPEDYTRDCEMALARDLRRNQWPIKLYQTLLDVARFGICATETAWVENHVYVPTKIDVPPTKFLGLEISKGGMRFETQKFLKYKGNEVSNVSPYNFFPDVRLPLSQMQDGEFVAVDTEYSATQLASMRADGDVAGTNNLPVLTTGFMQSERIPEHRFGSLVMEGNGRKSNGMHLVTKVQLDLVPKEVGIGKEDFPVRYHVWIANHQRVIKLEPVGYLHNQFTVNCGEFTPDMHGEMGRGLASVIDYLQSVVTWFINSHITSVRRTIDSKFIIDPAGVDTKQLESRSPYIFLRKNVSRSGVDRWIKQLQTVDATQGHMGDADSVGKMIQMVTGINDNAQGQYNSGRRSATEARAVTAGAASRLRMHTSLLWNQLFDPQGKQMLANLRQGMDEKLWMKVIGMPPEDPKDQMAYQKRYQTFKGDPETVAGMDDYMVYDSTMPSEKGFMAQSLQELVGIAMSNPETAFALNLNTTRMIEEIARLRGIDNIEQWRMTPQEQQEYYARLRQSAQPGTPANPVDPNQPVLSGGSQTTA